MNVFTHITSTAHPNVAVNLYCESDMTTFLLFTDMFGNTFITHFALNGAPSSITDITNNSSLVTWLAKPTNNVGILYVKNGNNGTRIKLSYPSGGGTPVISVTQLDNGIKNVIKAHSYATS